MGASEDFLVIRRAAVQAQRTSDGAHPVQSALAALLSKVARAEVTFIRLYAAGVQDEVIDLAYAVLGEQRPGVAGDQAVAS